MTNVIWQMETERRGHLKGYLFAAAAAVLWGFSGVITKYLLRRQMRPDELLVFRTLLASGLCFAFYTAYGKQVLKSYDPRTMITYTFLTSAVVWLTIRPPWKIDWAGINFSMWVFFIYLAGVATILPFALYSASLRHLEASRSSLTSMLEPVVAASVAWLWLGEKMEPMQIAGGAAVVGGVLLLQIESQMRRRNGGMERLRDGERERERAGEWETND
jgi:drug/metabolite transporter (DMT)-like permease